MLNKRSLRSGDPYRRTNRHRRRRRVFLEQLEPRNLLATITVTSTADGGPGTLRQAILDANQTAQPDTINLPVGNYVLKLSGADENASATGDLDITEELTIFGAAQARR